MGGNTYLVVGASRGIGRGLVEELAADSTNKVIATVRKPTDIFDKLPNVRLLTLDQAQKSSVDEVAAVVADTIDTLIINAAIGDDELILDTNEQRWEEYFQTNIRGPDRVVKAFLPALKRGTGKKIVFISSGSGSLATQIDNTKGFRGPYAVTKAANNMLAVQLHNELHRSEGFIVVPIHPGWVATDMGKIAGSGGMSVEDSAKGIVQVVKGLQYDDSAKFYKWDGQELPW